MVVIDPHVGLTVDPERLHCSFGDVDGFVVVASPAVPAPAAAVALLSEEFVVAHSPPLLGIQGALWGRYLCLNGKYERRGGFVFVA